MARHLGAVLVFLSCVTSILAQEREVRPRGNAALETRPIDIDPWCNRPLNKDFGTRPGNNLASLPRGKQTMAGVEFFIGDRFMHLASKRAADMPEAIENISVGGEVQKIHILHATSWGQNSVDHERAVGTLILHHGSGATSTIPIQFNLDVQDWWDYGNLAPSRTKEAWRGSNRASKEWGDIPIRLFCSSWDSPRPDDTIESIDYVSANETTCAPFMVAMTVERKPIRQSPVIEQLKALSAGLEYQNDRLVAVAIAGPNVGVERSNDEAAALVGQLGSVERILADNGTFTDEGIRSMAKVRGLKSLSLNGSGVSDEGLKIIGSIKTLERLHLHKARFTDAGLKHLSDLENLKVLDLSSTAVTDAGLEALGILNRIERVDLRNTSVSQEAKESFAARYPRGTIKF